MVSFIIEFYIKSYKYIIYAILIFFIDIYFVPVVTYLIFSCGDYTGRILSGIFQWVCMKY